jgi:excisionase family DNA binding protein
VSAAPVDLLLTVGEAARILRVSNKTIVRWFDAGHLEGCVLPSGHRRITAASVQLIRTSGLLS